jgi:sugar-phosphatase
MLGLGRVVDPSARNNRLVRTIVRAEQFGLGFTSFGMAEGATFGYAVSAVLVVEATERVLAEQLGGVGVLTAGEAFDADDFLAARRDRSPGRPRPAGGGGGRPRLAGPELAPPDFVPTRAATTTASRRRWADIIEPWPTRQRCARLPDRRWDACADLLWSGVVGRDHVALVSGVEAVLLDMDGTLVDPDGAIAHSSPAETTVRHCLPALGPVEVAESAARRLALQYDDLAGIAPTEGAQRLVAVLPHHAWRWAVVTAADRRLADARLAARRLGVAPPGCLVEDTASGLAAGRAAGALTATPDGHDGDLRLAHLGELVDRLEGGWADCAS